MQTSPNDYPFPSKKTLALREFLLGGPDAVKDWDMLEDKWKVFTRRQLGLVKVSTSAVSFVCLSEDEESFSSVDTDS